MKIKGAVEQVKGRQESCNDEFNPLSFIHASFPLVAIFKLRLKYGRNHYIISGRHP